MANDNGFNMHVFRDGRRNTAGRALLDALLAGLAAVAAAGDSERRRRLLIDVIVRAGELESILADSSARDAARISAVTNALADALVATEAVGDEDFAINETNALAEAVSAAAPFADGANDGDGRAASGATRIRDLARDLRGVEVPAVVRAAPPEGFSYYALHPLDFATLVYELSIVPGDGYVIGIRSIGTTLSAVVAAALRRRGVASSRITVRPTGHPYDRAVNFSEEDLRWVQRGITASASFFVVDEGPGLSGSSFLAVAELLVAAGVPRERITLLGTRVPDPERLLSPDGALRFSAFTLRAVTAARRVPGSASVILGGGAWRPHLCPDEDRWPATWAAMERPKFLDPTAMRFFKFKGLGRYGAEARDRSEWLHRAGFGLPPQDEGDGFISYPWLPGPLLFAADLDRTLTNRLADYCVFRARAFPAPNGGGRELVRMIRDNVEAAGLEPLDPGFTLEVRFPIIADARMMPHAFRRDARGEIMKVSATAHGDDHFFPGPTDIAWDLAGAIVEWQMSAEARRAFLDRYRRLSGDAPEGRLSAYLFAYALFRLAYTAMAAASCRGSAEEGRLLRDHRRYRELLDTSYRGRAGRGAASLLSG